MIKIVLKLELKNRIRHWGSYCFPSVFKIKEKQLLLKMTSVCNGLFQKKSTPPRQMANWKSRRGVERVWKSRWKGGCRLESSPSGVISQGILQDLLRANFVEKWVKGGFIMNFAGQKATIDLWWFDGSFLIVLNPSGLEQLQWGGADKCKNNFFYAVKTLVEGACGGIYINQTYIHWFLSFRHLKKSSGNPGGRDGGSYTLEIQMWGRSSKFGNPGVRDGQVNLEIKMWGAVK